MRAPLSYMTRYARGLLPRVPRLMFRFHIRAHVFGNSLISSQVDPHETSLEELRGKLAALKEGAMRRRPWARVAATGAAIVLTIAVAGFVLPYAGQGIDAATPQTQATATETPRPTRTPAPTATPIPILTPLPSLDDLRYYTPVAEAPAEAPQLSEAQSATPVPPRAPAQNQPSRAPVRATQPESV